MGLVNINIEGLQDTRNQVATAMGRVTDLKAHLRRILESAAGHVNKAPAPHVDSLYKLDQVCQWLDALGPLLDRRLDLARQVAAAIPGYRPGDAVAIDGQAIADYDRAVDDAAWLARHINAHSRDSGAIPQDLLDRLAREQGNQTFAALLAKSVSPRLLAGFLGGVAGRAADLELTADPGLDDFYQREDQLLNLLAGALSLGAGQLTGDDLDTFTTGWADIFTPGIGGANTAAASLLIGRGAWPDAFYTRLADTIAAEGRHGEEWLPAVPLNGVRDPAVNPQTGGHDLIGDPMAGLLQSAARFAPGWLCSYFTGGPSEPVDLPGFDYPDGKHADPQTVQVNARLRALLMDYGLDQTSGRWFGQAADTAALYEAQTCHTAGLAADTTAIIERFERDAVVYDHKSWWDKYKHDILQSVGLVVGLGTMLLVPVASPWIAAALVAADLTVAAADGLLYLQDGDWPDALIAFGCLLVPVAVGGIVRWVKISRAEITALETLDEITVDGATVTRTDLDAALHDAAARDAAPRPGPAGRTAPPGFSHPEAAHEIVWDQTVGSRTPFTKTTGLQPDTCYHVAGRGDFYTDATGTVTHVETEWGPTGARNPDLLHPAPNTTYVIHRGDLATHVYRTDDQSRTVLAVMEDYRPVPGGERSESIQTRIGHLGGGQYDGGHLIATSRGAGGEDIGTVPMLRQLNQGGGDYWNIEKQLDDTWRDLQKTNPGSRIDYQVQAHYTGTSRVPDGFTVKYSINGGEMEVEDLANVK